MFDIAREGRFRLARAPLLQAIVQVVFPLVSKLQTLAGVEPLQEKLSSIFPYMEQEQGAQFVVQINNVPLAAPAPQTSVSWKFSDDSGWTLALSSGAAALSVGSTYEGVEQFADRFESILDALHDALKVRRCDRIGVRYVNLVVSSESPTAWTQWFKPEISGWICSGILAPETAVQSQLVQTQLSAPLAYSDPELKTAMTGVIRHGYLPVGGMIPGVVPLGSQPFPLEKPAFVLDIDMSVQSAQPFGVRPLVRQFRELHSQVEGFFRWSLTEMGANHFGLEVV